MLISIIWLYLKRIIQGCGEVSQPSYSPFGHLHTLDPLKIREESQGVNLLSREGNSQTGHMMRENVEWVGYL